MRRIVFVFGLIAGALLVAMMIVNVAFADRIGFDRAEAIGYTTIVLAFLMAFFGMRSYRDNVAGGTVRFRKAFGVGILITLVASVCYVATWEAIYYGGMAPNFIEAYTAHTLERAREGGATEEELASRSAEMERFRVMYENPLVNAGMTFLEVFPIGLVMTLVSAGIVSRKRAPRGAGGLSPVADR